MGKPAVAPAFASFVIKAEDLPALNYLQRRHPRPTSLAWINRGTDQDLRPTTIDMLLRTLFHGGGSPSVTKLHQSAGLRANFSTVAEREAFARCFALAQGVLAHKQRSEMTAVFDTPQAAERSFRELSEAGVPPRAISILWRAGQFIKANHSYPPGHSRMSVAAASAGAGLAGALLGVTLLTIPGLGLVAAGGTILTQALGTMGAVGGALGASGGGIARMLTDIDVDDREAPYYAMAITDGKVFISVDPAACGGKTALVGDILMSNGGRFARAGRS